MIDKDAPTIAQARNQLARALARWENEGGATVSLPDDDEPQPVLSQEEQHILECLGAAVIAQWTELPTKVQKVIFEHAVSCGEPRHSVALREKIARFLHNHKNDRSGTI